VTTSGQTLTVSSGLPCLELILLFLFPLKTFYRSIAHISAHVHTTKVLAQGRRQYQQDPEGFGDLVKLTPHGEGWRTHSHTRLSGSWMKRNRTAPREDPEGLLCPWNQGLYEMLSLSHVPCLPHARLEVALSGILDLEGPRRQLELSQVRQRKVSSLHFDFISFFLLGFELRALCLQIGTLPLESHLQHLHFYFSNLNVTFLPMM
jgi:hypothetical protein